MTKALAGPVARNEDRVPDTAARAQMPQTGLSQRIHALQRSSGNRALTILLSQPARPRDETRAAPAIEVPSAGGQPLDAQIRAQFEPRYDSDFGKVRIHADASAAARTRAAGARAVTRGDNIAFAPGEYAPHTHAGRTLLAHELAHVAQQRVAGTTAHETAIESEADTAARHVATGATFSVGHRASAQAPYFTRVRIRGGREFEVGDVTVNRQASTDIRTHGNLLAGADQAHILVHGNKLGYEVSHTTPDDPFRWDLLKNIVDNEHLDIKAVSAVDTFNTHAVKPPSAPVVIPITLLSLRAGGITLETLSRQLAANPGQTLYTTSTDPARGQIYYDSTSGSRGVLGSNSLAHELFGHYALGMRGAMSGHGQNVGATPAITDPFGQAFVGAVNDYITGFAGASASVFESPTQFVSRAFLTQAMTDLSANGGTGLTRNGQSWSASAGFERIWLILSQNYRALGFARVPPPATPATTPAPTTTPTTPPATTPSTTTPAAPTPTPTTTPTTTPSGTTQPPATAPTTTPATTPALPTRAQIESAVTTWFNARTADEQFVFRQYLADITTAFPRTRPTELAAAIIPLLPAAAASTPAPFVPPP